MPPIVFPPEIEKALVASKKQIEEAEKEVARAKRVGLDVSLHEEALARARKLRDDLLSEYGRSAIRPRQ